MAAKPGAHIDGISTAHSPIIDASIDRWSTHRSTTGGTTFGPTPFALTGTPPNPLTKGAPAIFVGTETRLRTPRFVLIVDVPCAERPAASIDMQTALLILLSLQGIADGGRPQKDQPVLVGEHGPELFVPDWPGTVVPQRADPRPPPMTVLPPNTKMQAADDQRPGYGSEVLLDAANSGKIKLNSKAFGDWLADLPESENVEDLRPEIVAAKRAKEEAEALKALPPGGIGSWKTTVAPETFGTWDGKDKGF
jgi:hypothetical protein